MRVLFDHQSFSLQKTGGITRYFYEVIRHLNAIPDFSTITQLGLCTTMWPLEAASLPRGKVVHWGSRIVPSGVGTFFINESLLNPYSLFQGKVDIYHNTLYRFMPGIRARRLVATHHDCTPERFPHLFPALELKLIVRSRRKMLQQADLVFCVSEASRRDMQQFYDVETSRIKVLCHGPSTLFRSEAGSKELSARVGRPFILYVGVRFHYKNFNALIQAFADSGLHKDYDLLAIGGGPFSEAELQHMQRLGVRSKVIAAPGVSPEMLAEAYATASLFIYPSLYEGLGLPPLEAMMMGCPTLVAASPATLEVCQDASIFFDPADQADFTKKLAMAVQDTPERRSMIERGRALVQRRQWPVIVEQMAATYRSLF
jgi:glycosyltransferase involved in cell wall biosynthesis